MYLGTTGGGNGAVRVSDHGAYVYARLGMERGVERIHSLNDGLAEREGMASI